MHQSFLLSMLTALGLVLTVNSSAAVPAATSNGLATLNQLMSSQGVVQQIDVRDSRHCHERRRVCRNVTLNSGKKVRRCTTRRAFCHGAARTYSAPRGSH